MPIPALNEDGFLPPGVHDCTFDENRSRFGAFRATDRRPKLCAALAEFIEEVRIAAIFSAVLIDGSFVTDKPAPNDIDLLLVFSANHDFDADLLPSQYKLVCSQLIRRQRSFDVVFARPDSAAYTQFVDFFQQVRNQPDRRKGILRLAL